MVKFKIFDTIIEAQTYSQNIAMNNGCDMITTTDWYSVFALRDGSGRAVIRCGNQDCIAIEDMFPVSVYIHLHLWWL